MPTNPKPDLERTKFQIKHIYTQYKLHPAAEEVLCFSAAGCIFLIMLDYQLSFFFCVISITLAARLMPDATAQVIHASVQ